MEPSPTLRFKTTILGIHRKIEFEESTGNASESLGLKDADSLHIRAELSF